MRLYRLTHNASVLGSAVAIMAFEMAGWQTDPGLACPGGIPFSNAAENTNVAMPSSQHGALILSA